MIKKIIFVIVAFAISYPIFANDNNNEQTTTSMSYNLIDVDNPAGIYTGHSYRQQSAL